MSLAMIFDTETTGIPLFKEPSDHPDQPHIVEFAATLIDLDTRASVASMHLVARPDGWVIPAEVEAIHGLTTERALQIGVPEAAIARLAYELSCLADVRVGHSQQFDQRIVRIALKRFAPELADPWKEHPTACTAVLAKKPMGLAKFPKLAEAYEHFVGEAFPEAHTAKADTLATARLYLALLDNNAAIAA